MSIRDNEKATDAYLRQELYRFSVRYAAAALGVVERSIYRYRKALREEGRLPQ